VKTESLSINRTIELADCFRLFSACFYPPQDEYAINEDFLSDFCHLLERLLPEARPLLTKLQESFSQSTSDDLILEYARLFIGPFALIAPPYASVYIDKEKRLMGDSTMAVLRFYQEAGLSIDEDMQVPPDHIAIELEFMHYLLAQEAIADEKQEPDQVEHLQTLQADFCNRFLNPWVADFCSAIRKGTESDFYKSLADCLDIFMKIIHLHSRQHS
jgi:TorA maturation chaperone TorD